jgi:hypothetical protein
VKYPIKIRLYAEKNSSLYALARIWPDKATMIKEVESADSGTTACTDGVEIIDFKNNGKRRKKGIFAELHFYEAQLRIYILSHECLHAALSWFERVKMKSFYNEDGTHNERFVHTQDYMLYQLYQRLGKMKIGGWEQ